MIEAIMKPPNKFNTTVTTYLGSINVKYAPIIDADTVDIVKLMCTNVV